MNPYSSGYQASTTDWLSMVMIAAAVCFALFMSWRRGFDRGTFVNFLLEGVTLAAAAILLISAFYKPWFDAVMDNKTILIIVSFMTINYGFRDIAASIHRSRSSFGERDGEK